MDSDWSKTTLCSSWPMGDWNLDLTILSPKLSFTILALFALTAISFLFAKAFLEILLLNSTHGDQAFFMDRSLLLAPAGPLSKGVSR